MKSINLSKERIINNVVELSTDQIISNPNQPRSDYSDDISQLAQSIAQNGILQPISVRKKGSKYELITGERRLRAAKYCGFPVVPCIIHEVSDRHSAILALVENIQRQELSFFDEASAIEKLITLYGMTQEVAASKLGRAQSTIANKLRLLRLTEKERFLITQYSLTERHARALLRLGSVEDRLLCLIRL